jgi:hypothetical protein
MPISSMSAVSGEGLRGWTGMAPSSLGVAQEEGHYPGAFQLLLQVAVLMCRFVCAIHAGGAPGTHNIHTKTFRAFTLLGRVMYSSAPCLVLKSEPSPRLPCCSVPPSTSSPLFNLRGLGPSVGFKPDSALPMEAETLPPAQVDLQKGFTWHHGAYDKKTQGLQAERQFLAPNCIRYAGRPGRVGV